MSSLFEKAKEKLNKRKEELQKSENETYAIKYYSGISTSTRGNQMVVIITNGGKHKYISRGSVDDIYDLVASMVSGITGNSIKNDATIEDISAEYNYVVIAANPSINKEPTMIYIPENISDNQKEELDNFEKQVQKYNNEVGSFTVEVQKIISRKKVYAPGEEPENSVLK